MVLPLFHSWVPRGLLGRSSCSSGPQCLFTVPQKFPTGPNCLIWFESREYDINLESRHFFSSSRACEHPLTRSPSLFCCSSTFQVWDSAGTSQFCGELGWPNPFLRAAAVLCRSAPSLDSLGNDPFIRFVMLAVEVTVARLLSRAEVVYIGYSNAVDRLDCMCFRFDMFIIPCPTPKSTSRWFDRFFACQLIFAPIGPIAISSRSFSSSSSFAIRAGWFRVFKVWYCTYSS